MKQDKQSIARVALVSGANRGIGLEIVSQLARRGLTVVLGSRDAASGRQASADLDGDGTVVVEALDVNDPASVTRAVGAIVDRFGRLDVLVNNAGILIDDSAKASTIDIERAEETLATNVVGAWRLTQAVLPSMRKNRYGRIVNLSSQLGTFSDIGGSGGSWPVYRVSKAALNALTLLFASELRGDGILVNAAIPGWVRTRMGGAGAPRSVAEGADTPVWLATLPDGGPTGQLFEERKRIDW